MNNERPFFEFRESLLATLKLLLFYLVRNTIAKKIELSWNWNHRLDVLPLLIKSKPALTVAIAAGRR